MCCMAVQDSPVMLIGVQVIISSSWVSSRWRVEEEEESHRDFSEDTCPPCSDIETVQAQPRGDALRYDAHVTRHGM